MSDVFLLSVPKMNPKTMTSNSSFGSPSTPLSATGGGSPSTPTITSTPTAGVGGGGNWGLLYAVPAAVTAAFAVYHGAKFMIKANSVQTVQHNSPHRGRSPARGGGGAVGSSDDDNNNVNQFARGGASPGAGSPAAAGSPRGRSPAGSPAAGGMGASRKSSNSLLQKNSRYKKGKLIGRGGFGAVYVGLDNETGEMIAIKEMEAKGAAELKLEFDLLKNLHHEHVVNIHGFEVFGSKARLYLEWVAGGSLSDIAEKYGRVPENRLKTYAKQMLLGLGFLHEKGILHRDIKPGNILVDHRGCLKVTDFGLSRHLDSINPTTRTCGTVIYMAPECVKGHFAIGSDLWAVGATIVELASGERPWSHLDKDRIDNNFALMYHIAQLAGQRGHHPLIPADLSPEGKDFLLKCFAPFTDDRGTCASLLKHPWLQHVGSPIQREGSVLPTAGGDSITTTTAATTATYSSSNPTNGTGTTVTGSCATAERRELDFEDDDEDLDADEEDEEDVETEDEADLDENKAPAVAGGSAGNRKKRRKQPNSLAGLSSDSKTSTESPGLHPPPAQPVPVAQPAAAADTDQPRTTTRRAQGTPSAPLQE